MSVTREGSLLNIHMCSKRPHDYHSACLGHTPVKALWYLEMLNRGIFPAPRGLFVISTVMDETAIDNALAAFEDTLRVIAPYLKK